MNMSATATTTTGKLQEEMARAMSAAQSGDRAGAYDIFQTLATRYENTPELWVWLGGTSSNLDEAEAAFQRAALLDPNNEEANLGLRWVALRRQVVGASTTTSTPLDTGVFTQGRVERNTTSFDLNAAFDNTIAAATGPLGTGFLTNTSNTGATGTGSLTGPLRTADVDSSLKMKVDGKASGKRRGIPMGAIILIIVALTLYAFAAYMLFGNN